MGAASLFGVRSPPLYGVCAPIFDRRTGMSEEIAVRGLSVEEDQLLKILIVSGSTPKEISTIFMSKGYNPPDKQKIVQYRNLPEVDEAMSSIRENMILQGLASRETRINKLAKHAQNIYDRMYYNGDDESLPIELDARELDLLNKQYLGAVKEISRLVDAPISSQRINADTVYIQQNNNVSVPGEGNILPSSETILKALREVNPDVADRIGQKLESRNVGNDSKGNDAGTTGVIDVESYPASE